MKTHLLVLILCFCYIQKFYCQEDDGVVSLTLPVRNSLTFNRYTINPTFSFVREQNKYISLFNKREWVSFEDAPLTYLASYSGRFAENIGAGVGLFQQNYGVLTTFGGVVNFAYNVRLDRDSNLTFGLNVGAYKSGVNTGKVVTNFDDPSLQNVPENFITTINPGINYGLAFLDFGISANNLIAYNFNTSEMIEDNPEQYIQAHIMYTGYMSSRGFFDDAKFSGIIKSEFGKEHTDLSGIAMLTVPKGIWAQVGYNTRYGISGGIGINITKEIALEYNYEKAIGDYSTLGNSHAFHLAYRFINRRRYDYSSGDEVSGLISIEKRRPIIRKSSKSTKKPLAEQKTKDEAEAKAKLLAEQKAKEEAEAKARLLAEQKAKEEAEAKAKLLAEQKAKEEAEEQARLLAEQKAKKEAEEQARLLAEQKAKEEAEEQARLLAEQKAKEEAEAKAKEELIIEPKDELGKTMYALAQQTAEDKATMDELIVKYNDILAIKDQDLKDLKEENDLSEQGIVVAPKPFKSITEENNKLQAIRDELDHTIETRKARIEQLKSLYRDNYDPDTIAMDEVNLFYKKTIDRLESEQLKAVNTRAQLDTRLEQIRIATEFERRRRIKRATYDNEEQRYAQDRAILQRIKETTATSSIPSKIEDFDFGEQKSRNVQILKNVKNVESGYYLIIAVHSDTQKRNEFLRKVIAAGRRDVDFFYDINTSKYYIYYSKHDNIEAANRELQSKEDKPYNAKMSIVKIEN